MNIINACDKTTKRKKRIHAKKPKSDKDTTIPEEKELTYGIDCLNIGDPAVESENDSKLLPRNVGKARRHTKI